jgi:hypothetical protein
MWSPCSTLCRCTVAFLPDAYRFANKAMASQLEDDPVADEIWNPTSRRSMWSPRSTFYTCAVAFLPDTYRFSNKAMPRWRVNSKMIQSSAHAYARACAHVEEVITNLRPGY